MEKLNILTTDTIPNQQKPVSLKYICVPSVGVRLPKSDVAISGMEILSIEPLLSSLKHHTNADEFAKNISDL